MPAASDYYEALQVSPNADGEVIQAAYNRLVEKWHAERRPGDPSAFGRLSLLDEAYAALSDPVKRQEYDSRRRQPATCGAVGAEPAPATAVMQQDVVSAARTPMPYSQQQRTTDRAQQERPGDSSPVATPIKPKV
jgi:curved DNA-binding protein CbpA